MVKLDSSIKIEEKKLEMELERMEIEKAIAMSEALASKLDEE